MSELDEKKGSLLEDIIDHTYRLSRTFEQSLWDQLNHLDRITLFQLYDRIYVDGDDDEMVEIDRDTLRVINSVSKNKRIK